MPTTPAELRCPSTLSTRQSCTVRAASYRGRL